MANEQEQQLVGQESGISAQPSPDQQPNLYQTITAMNPMQMLELKKRVHTIKSADEIRRNVGDVSAKLLFEQVQKGEHTLESAMEKSKTMVSPISKDLDAQYFKAGMTADEFKNLRIKYENTWSTADRGRFLSLWNDLRSKRDATDRAKIQRNKNIATRDKAINKLEQTNNKYVMLAQVDFNDLKGNINEVKNFVPSPTDEVITPTAGKVLNQYEWDTALKTLEDLINEDIEGKKPDQMTMDEAITTLANNVPKTYIDEMKGYWMDGQWFAIPEKDKSPAIKRWILAQEWQNQLKKAKNHTANITEIDYDIPSSAYETTKETPESGSFWQK